MAQEKQLMTYILIIPFEGSPHVNKNQHTLRIQSQAIICQTKNFVKYASQQPISQASNTKIASLIW